MKNSRMLILGMLLFLVGSFGEEAFCEDSRVLTGFDVGASVTPDVIYPYEPVWITYVMKNVSSMEQTTQTRRPPSFAIKEGLTGTWRTYTSYGPQPPPLITPITKIMRPGESETGSLLIDVDFGGAPVFSRPGEYFVKVGTWVGESASQRIVLKEAPTEEKQAIGYIQQHRLYFWFSEDTVNVCRYLPQVHGEDPNSELAEFVRRFPTSRYAQRVKLAQLWIKKHDAGDDPKALQAVHSELEALALDLPEPMKAMCWYSAGEAATKRGDVARAETDFQHAISGGTNAFIIPRVPLGRHLTARTLDKPQADEQKTMVAETKSEEERHGISQESWKAIEPWRQVYQQQVKDGKISQEECDRQLVVAQLKLLVAVDQQQREMRRKWKAGEITEQDYKQWLQQKAQELYQKENSAH